MNRKIVIIGGVAGGATAAARIRRLDENAEVIVFEKSGYISYANCGLPYYIGGVIREKNALTLQTPQSFWKRFRIDMRVRHEVIAINSETKKVSVKNLDTNEIFEESYDKLLIATGAKPIKSHDFEDNIEEVFYLRTVEDTFRIHEFVNEKKPKTAVIAGGGFIGLELAENLCNMGIDVTIVQRPKQLMNPFDEDMAAFIHGKMRSKGIKLMLGHSVAGYKKSGDGIEIELKDGITLKADMAAEAIGVVPDNSLAKAIGLKLGLKGSIVVNDHMETSIPEIYAVGDAVEVKHYITGKKAVISLAGPANKQGRIAADNMCGGDSVYLGSQGSSVIKIFDMTAAVTGINERMAKEAGIEYEKICLSPMSHASYYPGGKLMTMKVIFEKETYKLLGAQIVGYDGVDKRIDVLAASMHAGLNAIELKDLDLAYAPPFSSAKDPVNMAGFMAENISKGKVKQFFLEDIESLPQDGSAVLLDTRTAYEYKMGHIEGFINLPVDELRERLGEIEKGKPVYVICQSGLRSYIACRILSQNGFDCFNFAGGFRLYETVLLDKIAKDTALPCGME